MPAAPARRESSSYSSTDNTDNRLAAPATPWNGSQASQASWFNEKLKSAEKDFQFFQLSVSATVTTERGLITVFSPEHALEHAKGECQGTMRAPNRRKREDLLARSLAKSAASATSPMPPSPSGAHGGHPTPPSVSVPTTTSTTSKPTTMLQDILGELADGYKISNETIEKVDLAYLNFFLNDFASQHLSDIWRKRCGKSGIDFVIKFLADMNSKGVSITAEETIEMQMRNMLEGGLAAWGDVSFTSYLDMTGAYEELNEVRVHKIDSASLAHQYKRLIVSLSPAIEQKILLRIALIELSAAPTRPHRLSRREEIAAPPRTDTRLS